MKMTTYIKIGFSDWLYVLVYEIEADLKTETNKPDYSNLFDLARKSRFRFENKSLYSEAALTNMEFQYGNYHSALMCFEDDFVYQEPESIRLNILNFENNEHFRKISIVEKTKAKIILKPLINNLVTDRDRPYKLHIDSMSVKKKVAPFGKHDFFESYMIFDERQSNRFKYIELGSD